MYSLAFTGASALILLVASAWAKPGHHQAHEHLQDIYRRHRHGRTLARSANNTLEKRATCSFPANAGLVAVTPECGNGGWAFAPDKVCEPGSYCPYACPPGQVSMQWDPSVTSYEYPGSMNGGLLCNSDGTVSKPFPDRPYCQSTTANIGVQNNCGRNVAFCQTVLPGDEDMLIPTDVTSWSKLAVPDMSYWANTAAHYYINPPGVSSTEGCVWGSTSNPYGNWAPYVAGANTDSTGETFIKLGWNPIYLEPATPFRNQMPTWGVRIECPNGGCQGLPCAIDPSVNKVNEMNGSASDGAGGGAFCVVTVAQGSSANFVVFDSESSAPSSNTGTSSGEWGNVKQGAQFYQSSLVSSSFTAISATATESNTTASLSTFSPLPTNGTVSNLSMSDISGPSGQPTYQLFDATSTAGPAQTASLSALATGTVNVPKQTGAASSIEASFALLLLGIGATLV